MTISPSPTDVIVIIGVPLDQVDCAGLNKVTVDVIGTDPRTVGLPHRLYFLTSLPGAIAFMREWGYPVRHSRPRAAVQAIRSSDTNRSSELETFDR
jgi:hypothetical protein